MDLHVCGETRAIFNRADALQGHDHGHGREGQQQHEIWNDEHAPEQEVPLRDREVGIERKRDLQLVENDAGSAPHADDEACHPGDGHGGGRTSGAHVHARVEVTHLGVDAVVPHQCVDAQRHGRQNWDADSRAALADGTERGRGCRTHVADLGRAEARSSHDVSGCLPGTGWRTGIGPGRRRRRRRRRARHFFLWRRSGGFGLRDPYSRLSVCRLFGPIRGLAVTRFVEDGVLRP
jgi:hypothetical protein